MSAVGPVLAAVDWRLRLTRFLERSLGVVLMYHAIDSTQGYAGRPPVTAGAFTRQLALLASRYAFSTLPDVVARRGASRKQVVLTFDDGHRSFIEKALPVLLQQGIPATVFLCSGALGTEAFMSRDDVRDLSTLPGIEVGNHTRSHCDLRAEASPAVLEREIVGGRKDLEDLIGMAVSSFSYPYGRLSRDSMAIVRHSHARAVTVLPGMIWPDTDPYAVPRVGATGISLDRFAFDLTDLRHFRSRGLRYDADGRVGRNELKREAVIP